jgi:hypothetical protein
VVLNPLACEKDPSRAIVLDVTVEKAVWVHVEHRTTPVPLNNIAIYVVHLCHICVRPTLLLQTHFSSRTCSMTRRCSKWRGWSAIRRSRTCAG